MNTVKLRTTFEEFCLAARAHEDDGRVDAAWACVEAAHIIGQRVTRLHATTHWKMLGLGWRTGDWREVSGQLSRRVASILVTRFWVPVGNRGRANVSALASEPILADLPKPAGRSVA